METILVAEIGINANGDVNITKKLIELYNRHKEGKSESYATPRGYDWDQVADLFQKIAGQIKKE